MTQAVYKLLEVPIIYDLVQNGLGGKRYFTILKQAFSQYLLSRPCAHVLDVGCGTGILVEWVTGEYYGIDINPKYVKKVGETGKGYFYVADATALPFKNNQFDVVCTIGVLHHLHPNLCRKMLSEMVRVCKKEGQLLIFDGLVPENRFNIIGYAIAKLDRGRYKMRLPQFQAMLTRALPCDARIDYEVYKVFPSEYVLSVVTK
jgi:ubiquinone/menaquinone biosynthesis C-methylase UbiE